MSHTIDIGNFDMSACKCLYIGRGFATRAVVVQCAHKLAVTRVARGPDNADVRLMHDHPPISPAAEILCVRIDDSQLHTLLYPPMSLSLERHVRARCAEV